MMKQSMLPKGRIRNLNSYDTLYTIASKNPIFNEEEWRYSANNGTLDVYANSLIEFMKRGIDVEKYREKYNLNYADMNTRLMALYNETGADTTNTTQERERPVYNDDGSVKLDVDGITPVKEKYHASDYEYNLEIIRKQNDYNEQIKKNEVLSEIRNSYNTGEHILSGIIGASTSLVGGAIGAVENLVALGASAVDAAFTGGGFDKLTENLGTGKYDIGISEAIVDFETNYTSMRDENGNYTNWGRYVGGIMTSLGEMLPAMLIGYGAGSAASAAGAGAKTVGTISKVASQASFYGSMSVGNVQDMYRQYQANGADIDSAAILSSAAIKSTLQWCVEVGLGKILGATSLDNMVFGHSIRSTASKSLTSAGIKTVFKDFVQEGLEEVFQDTSDFLVDSAYEMFIKEYKGTSNITWQSLIDSFVIGGIMSFAGSAKNIITTQRVYAGDKKLNKIASWQYGLNMETFAESMQVIDQALHYTDREGVTGPKKYSLTSKDRDAIYAATVESYAAYRMITSIYEEIGEERFKAANDVLDKITSKIKSGFYNIADVDSYVDTIKGQLAGLAESSIKKVAKEMKEGGVTKVEDVIKKDSEPSDKDDKLKEVAETLEAEKIVVTDGDIFTKVDGVYYISKNKVSKTVGELLQLKSVKDLVESVKNKFEGTPAFLKFSSTFKSYYGRDASNEEVIYALFYDKDFFGTVLLDGNKDVYKLLSYFVELGQTLKTTSLSDKIQKTSMARIINNWVESLTQYCILHVEADPGMFLYAVSDAEKRKSIEKKIVRERWVADTYNKVVLKGVKSLSKAVADVLRRRFDDVFPKEIAEARWAGVNSDDIGSRQWSMNDLVRRSKLTFFREYDGVTYLEDTSIGNRAFNHFLKNKKLTVSTFLSRSHLTESEVLTIEDMYGEINDDNILKFRQMQFNSLHNGYTVSLNKSGNVEISVDGKIVGFSKYKKVQKDIQSGKYAESFVTATYARSDEISKLVTEDLKSNYFTIDDVIINPSILDKDVRDKIIKYAKDKYDITIDEPTIQFTFLYLRDYFLQKTKGSVSIVMNHDGEFVLASVAKLLNLFKNKNVKITKDSKIEDIFKAEYIPEGLKLVFMDGNDAFYISYRTEEKDGRTVTTFDNTIYIGKELLKESDEHIRFVVAHELQHAYQFANNMNLGADYKWLSKVEKKQRKQIIADVRKHVAHLFKGVPKDSDREAQIVNDYVYHATGESQAYGLEGVDVLDFVPVLSQNDKNVLRITFPWNKTYTINNVEKADLVSSVMKKVSDNLFEFTDLSDLFSDIYVDNRVDHTYLTHDMRYLSHVEDDRYKKILELSKYFMQESDNSDIFSEWLKQPFNTSFASSEDAKKKVKDAINEKDKRMSLEALQAAIAPDVPIDELIEMDIPFVRIQTNEKLLGSPFVSVFVGTDVDAIKYMLETHLETSERVNDILNTYLIVGNLKVKDLLLYIPTKFSEGLIEPSKLTNSKVFKLSNKIYSPYDAHKNVTFMFTSDKRIIVNPMCETHRTSGKLKLIRDGVNGKTYKPSEISNTTIYSTDFDRYDIESAKSLYNESVNVDDFRVQTAEVRNLNGETVESDGIILKDNWYSNFHNVHALIYENGKISISRNALDTRDSVGLNIFVTDKEGRKITAEETETSIVNVQNQQRMSLAPKYDDEGVRKPNKNELEENDPRAKHFIKLESKPSAKYVKRYLVINDDGTQRLRKNGKPLYHYVYKPDVDSAKNRYVSKRKYVGTRLEHFFKKYERLYMSKRMQRFILSAEGLDPVLQERIDGSKAGTLTERDVMDYFRSAERMDDKTFKAINDAFFENEYITTFKELQDKIEKTLHPAWALNRIIREQESLKPYIKLLESTTTDVMFLTEAIQNIKNSIISKRYDEIYGLFDRYFGRSLDLNDEYSRLGYMKLYDGTITSEWLVAVRTRYVAIHKYNITHKTQLPDEVVEDAYSELAEGLDSSRESMLDAIRKREIVRKAQELMDKGLDYNLHVASIVDEVDDMMNQLRKMSTTKIKAIYEKEGGIGKILIENAIAESTGEVIDIPNNVPTLTSYAVKNNIDGMLRTIRRNLTPKELDDFVSEHSDLFDKGLRLRKSLYQNEVKSKTVDAVHYRNKPVEELLWLVDEIAKLKNEVLDRKRLIKESIKLKERTDKERDRTIKRLQKKNEELERKLKNAKKKISESDVESSVTQFIVENETITLRTNVPIPQPLKKFMQSQYTAMADTTVKHLSEKDEKHVKMISKDFYENNAESLNNLTQGDVDEIVDFYTGPNVPLSEITAPYIATEIWVLTYLIECGRKGTGNFVISSDTLSLLESTLKNLQSMFGTGQVTWREALKKLNPQKTIYQSLATSVGVTIDEKDQDALLKAIESRDMKKVEEEKNRIYTKYLSQARAKKASRRKLDKVLDKILQYERLAMLSGPGTWVRNWSSNFMIESTNKLSDGMSGKMEKLLFKLFPKSQEVKGQYQIYGTKVSQEVHDYIQANLIDNKLLESVMNALIKYDTRNERKGEKSVNILTEMIVGSIKSMYHTEHLSNNKYVSKVEDFIRERLSDNKSVEKAMKMYLGKMITEDLANGRIKAKVEVLSNNTISKQFLAYVAEAYKMAAYDYMHKSNFITSLESRLARKNFGAYFMYKQIFPFAGASYNWFIEGINYTPIGLAKAIINFAKLEKTVEKMEESRRTYQYNDTGVSSDFAKYITIRNINKGVIGTVGFLIGALLAGFGYARLDEEDDKYKLVIADQVYIDITNVFGTQGVFLGISVFDSIIKQNSSPIDVLAAALNQMFIDSTFSDMFNNFRYSKSLGDWIVYQPVSMLNMLMPNFLKTITALTESHDVQYSDGILGKVQKVFVNSVPFISHAMPHYYDPYTGEKQIPYKFPFLTDLVSKLTPLGISVYNVSDYEKLCIEYGVNKGQLTGRYTVNDESVKLSSSQIEKLNLYYGKLNVDSFKEFENHRNRFKIQQSDGSYKTSTWYELSDKEKAAIISRTMTNNSGYAKIYILTDSGKYKYYATDEEYKLLRSLGITKNVYKATGRNKGFVKTN